MAISPNFRIFVLLLLVLAVLLSACASNPPCPNTDRFPPPSPDLLQPPPPPGEFRREMNCLVNPEGTLDPDCLQSPSGPTS